MARVRRARITALNQRIRRLPGLRVVLRRVFLRDLRRLHDALGSAGLGDRYWVCGGLLLGWAREGDVLRQDPGDADFAIRCDDFEPLLDAVPIIARAGFRPLFRFVNHAGEVTEVSFLRHGAKFEFFVKSCTDGVLRYFMYGFDDTGPVEVTVEEPEQPLEPFEFVGRTWLKPADHESYLAITYGDWRTPDRGWSYLRQPNIVDRRPWVRTDYGWAGEDLKPHALKRNLPFS